MPLGSREGARQMIENSEDVQMLAFQRMDSVRFTDCWGYNAEGHHADGRRVISVAERDAVLTGHLYRLRCKSDSFLPTLYTGAVRRLLSRRTVASWSASNAPWTSSPSGIKCVREHRGRRRIRKR